MADSLDEPPCPPGRSPLIRCVRALSAAVLDVLAVAGLSDSGTEPYERHRLELQALLETLDVHPESHAKEHGPFLTGHGANHDRAPNVEADAQDCNLQDCSPAEECSQVEDMQLTLSSTVRSMLGPSEWAGGAGGVEALAIKVNFLAVDIEHNQQSLEKIVSEADEVIQGIFERTGILHARMARIESMLGIPPWQPEEDGDEQAKAASEDVEQATAPKVRTCCRGHPLSAEGVEIGGPPRMCGFCKERKETTHQCSQGCYFHVCSECMEPDQTGPRCTEVEEQEEDALDPQESTGEAGVRQDAHSSGKPSEEHIEEDARCCEGLSATQPQTPSTDEPTEVEQEGDVSESPSVSWASERAFSDGRQAAPSQPPPPATSDSSRPAGAGAAEGGPKGMISRLAELEEQLMQLAQRFLEFEGPAMVLAQRAQTLPDSHSEQTVQRLIDEVREELSAFVTSSNEALHEEVKQRGKTTAKSVKADCSSMLAQAQEELRAEIHSTAREHTEQLRVEFSGMVEDYRAEIKSTAKEHCERLRKDFSGQLQARAVENCAPASTQVAAVQETDPVVRVLHRRMDALEGKLPRMINTALSNLSKGILAGVSSAANASTSACLPDRKENARLAARLAYGDEAFGPPTSPTKNADPIASAIAAAVATVTDEPQLDEDCRPRTPKSGVAAQKEAWSAGPRSLSSSSLSGRAVSGSPGSWHRTSSRARGHFPPRP